MFDEIKPQALRGCQRGMWDCFCVQFPPTQLHGGYFRLEPSNRPSMAQKEPGLVTYEMM